MKYRAVVFDLDGTLLDTLEDLKEALNHVLAAYGEPEVTLEQVRQYVGNGNRRLIARSLREGEQHPQLEAMFADFVKQYLAHDREKTVIYPGIEDLLTACRKRGLKLAVVSNKYEDAVKDLMAYYFPGVFDACIGDQEGRRRKPAPDEPMEALRELGVRPEEALYVGDSNVDAETARNTGMDAVLVSWGFRDRRFLEEEPVLGIIDAPMELLKYV